jgi:hypothetical protein
MHIQKVPTSGQAILNLAEQRLGDHKICDKDCTTSGQASPNLAEQRLRDYKLLSLGLQTLLMRLQILSLDYKLCYWTTKVCYKDYKYPQKTET